MQLETIQGLVDNFYETTGRVPTRVFVNTNGSKALLVYATPTLKLAGSFELPVGTTTNIANIPVEIDDSLKDEELRFE